MESLKNIELFETLEADELKKVAGLFQVRNLKEGQYLYKEGDPRENLYIVNSGQIFLYQRNEMGSEISIAYFHTHDFFGESGLLDDNPHANSAKIVEDSELLVLTRDDFNKLVDVEPMTGAKILAQITRIISRRLRTTTNKVVESAAQYLSGKSRTEHDLLGDKDVPYEAYYGIQTLRAMENFPITGVTLSHYGDLIIALAAIKKACAYANNKVGKLDDKLTHAINEACDEIMNRRYHMHFTVDMFQGGAGTSTNMNANEVIANRALEHLGRKKGEYQYCHPNNHVNLSQSTNDVYPSAIKLACFYKHQKLIAKLRDLIGSFKKKGEEFDKIIKMGRTQLQDAVPMTLGQEFTAFAVTLEEEIERLNDISKLLLEVNLGGTAIGTGINASKEYSDHTVSELSRITGFQFKLAENLVEATQDTGAFVIYSGALKRLSIKLSKISNDLRLLSSGPRAGFNEINLPKLQPGSSIMPGKVNPVMPELVNQVAYNVIGNDLTVTMAAEAGQLQLNVMEPVIAQSLFESMDMLKNAMMVFKDKCVDGIEANAHVTKKYVTNSIGLVTALNPILGYEHCSSIAKEALETGKSIYKLVLEKELMTKEQLEEVLSVDNLLGRS